MVFAMLPAYSFFAEEADDNGTEYNEDYDNGNDYDNDVDADEDEDADDEDADDEDADDEDADDEDANDEDADDADEDDADEDEADVDADDEEEEVVVPVVPVTEEITDAVVLRFVIGETAYTRNGVQMPALDAAPFIDAAVGRTMVPLAAISQGLGATVTWDGENRNVVINNGEIVLNVDTELPGGMGQPAIVDGRTFVPVAFVSAELDATTRWDRDAQAVYVYN